MSQSPADGSSASSSFDSSSRMRSALMIDSRSRIAPIASTIAGSGSNPSIADEPRGTQHPQRIVTERDLGAQRRAQAACGEVGEAAVRIDERFVQPGFEVERHRVDGEVAARQVGLDVVGVRDVGLAALGAVHVGAERRDLEGLAVLLAADGAEPLTLRPHRVGPWQRPARQPSRDGRRSRCRCQGRRTVEERVAHAPADEVGAVSGRAQPAGQCVGR